MYIKHTAFANVRKHMLYGHLIQLYLGLCHNFGRYVWLLFDKIHVCNSDEYELCNPFTTLFRHPS